MEATSQRPQEAESIDPDVGCLGMLVERWQDAGAAVPIAIVVSVFDDVLAALPEAPDERDADFDAIVVDDAGHASTRAPIGLCGAGRLLVRALGDEVPSAARPLVARLTDGERPADAEQLRQWMRDALGAPASREEVTAAFFAVSEELSEAETLLPAPAVAGDGESDDLIPPIDGASVVGEAPSGLLSVAADAEPSRDIVATSDIEALDDDDEILAPPEIVEEEEQETLPPEPSLELSVPPLASEEEEPRAIAGEASLPPERPFDTQIDLHPPEVSGSPEAPDDTPLEVPEAVAAGEILDGADAVEAHSRMPSCPVPDGRKVVRHEYSPPTVSVRTAPAARRSARAAAMGPDSILVPNDRKSGAAWLVVLGAVAALVYFLFFA